MSIPAKVLSAIHLGKQVLSSDGSLTILHDISFDVCEGESVAITGVSGSGKSTLLGLLAGLDSPTSGHVELASQNLSHLDEDGRAKLRGQKV
jgi:putative ABC transport system ATP-binding protein